MEMWWIKRFCHGGLLEGQLIFLVVTNP